MSGRAPVSVTTVGDLVVGAARRAPRSVVLAFPERRVTAEALLDGAYGVARGLRALGVRRGDAVGVLMPNCVEFVEALAGASLLGARVVLVNARYRTEELAYVVRDAGLRTVVTTDALGDEVDFVALLRAALPAGNGVTCVLLGEREVEGVVGRAELAARAAAVDPAEVDAAAAGVAVRDDAIMMYTSGTTARPKGCRLSHEALVRTAAAIVERYELGPEDVWWCPLPLFHLAGLLPLLAGLLAGSRVASMTDFEPGAALRQLVEERATFHFGVFPAINQALLDEPGFAEADLSSIRYVNAQPGSPALERALAEAYRHARLLNAYGCTELGGIVSLTDPRDPGDVWPRTSGRPWPGIEVRVVDPETGADLPHGERGELVARGWSMFSGYHGDPALTAAAVDAEGWFHTGDIGSIDADGRVSYHGRYKDMLKVGGENVAAAEVEAFLGTHPAVRLAQVVGVPDARLGEVAAAFVELAPGAAATAEELIAYCRGRIASYKVPRHVRFVTAWPMSATKIQKFRLRDELLAELQARSA
jgi:acyl-CoA synthetase (AMP-forming)/AMP-acid ligase II